MNCEITTCQHWDLIRVSGEIYEWNLPELEAAFDSAFSGRRHVILDASQVMFLNSAGLGMLVRARKRADEEGQRFVLCRLSKFVRRALELPGVLRIFDVAASVDEAGRLILGYAASVTCPVHGCGATMTVPVLDDAEPLELTCKVCLASIVAQLESGAGSDLWCVSRIALPTYEGESVRLLSQRTEFEGHHGPNHVASVLGRADAFAAHAIERIRDTVPSNDHPPAVVWDLSHATGLSEPAWVAMRRPGFGLHVVSPPAGLGQFRDEEGLVVHPDVAGALDAWRAVDRSTEQITLVVRKPE